MTAINPITVAERRRALRALLLHPLLQSGGRNAEAFSLVRRHENHLRKWLHTYPGWSLVLDGDVARLNKVPADLGDCTRSAQISGSGQSFSRRSYAMLCLALEVLEKSERQTILGRIADGILAAASTDPVLSNALPLSFQSGEERRDLVAVVRLLIDLGVLTRVHGDEHQYVTGSGDVLYNVDRPILSRLLAVRISPSTVTQIVPEKRLEEITREVYLDTPEDRNMRLRHSLYRRLLDDPVVYLRDLSADEMSYLQSQRHAIIENIHEVTGLFPEVREEGIALVDLDDELTDVRMPEEGTDGHFTLLLAEFLAQRLKECGNDVALVGETELHRHAVAAIERYGRFWRGDARDPGAAAYLLSNSLTRLSELRLVASHASGVTPLAAIARYATAEPLFAGADDPERT